MAFGHGQTMVYVYAYVYVYVYGWLRELLDGRSAVSVHIAQPGAHIA